MVIMGAPFFRNFYTMFDVEKQMISIALPPNSYGMLF